ncbi:MAG: hypothetical protein IKS52_11125 [Clostridia bacterium]|nr:hypothetical protein [Clostridia bacterium]
MRLPNEFTPKCPLKLRKDGSFRILMMSDAHQKPGDDVRTIRAMGLLIDRTRPDLVMLGGDNVAACASEAEFEAQPEASMQRAAMSQTSSIDVYVLRQEPSP